jgi:hypothetical protein
MPLDMNVRTVYYKYGMTLGDDQVQEVAMIVPTNCFIQGVMANLESN